MYLVEPSSIMNQTFFKEIQEELTCSICTGVLIDPMQCSECEHSFCRSCISQWIATQGNESCPFKCQNFVLVSSPRLLMNLLQSLVFKCESCQNLNHLTYNEKINHIENVHCADKIDYCKSLQEEGRRKNIDNINKKIQKLIFEKNKLHCSLKENNKKESKFNIFKYIVFNKALPNYNYLNCIHSKEGDEQPFKNKFMCLQCGAVCDEVKKCNHYDFQ